MGRRRATLLCGVLDKNEQLCMPSKRTLGRRREPTMTPRLGLQPTEVFGVLNNWGDGPLHVCCDEIAVNQRVDHVPCTHPRGFEIAGLANRCVRENNEEGFQYVLLDEGGMLVRKTWVTEAGEFEQEDANFDSLDNVTAFNEVPRATLCCVWIVHSPVRGSSHLHVAVIPTMGDLTCADDISMLHLVISQAHANGRAVTSFGSDNASPHAALQRGIVRLLCNEEFAAIRKAANAFMKDHQHLIVSEADQGSPKSWEPAAKAIAPAFQRPISVLMDLLSAYSSAKGKPARRAQSVLKRQWVVPCSGLPYGGQVCGITGQLLAISTDWRHDNRLLVCSPKRCLTHWEVLLNISLYFSGLSPVNQVQDVAYYSIHHPWLRHS